MADRLRVFAEEFSRNFGRYRGEAQAGKVIEVTSGGQIVGAYISALELERFERLKRRERQVFKVGKLPDDIIQTIETAQYGVISADAH